MTKNQEPKRHHYLPVFYQSGFAGEGGLLWLYDRKRQKFAPRPMKPTVICCEREFYTIDPDGERDRRIESKYLAQIDGDGAEAIRQFTNGQRLGQEWTESFSIFIALLITRSPAFRKTTTDAFRAMAEEYMRIGFTDVDRASRMLERYRRQTGDAAQDVTPESMTEAVRGGHIQISVNETPFLRHMFTNLEFLARYIAAFEWEVLIAPDETGFIVCDYPCVVVPPRNHPENTGLAFSGTTKYLPIARTMCLRMGGPITGFLAARFRRRRFE